MNSIFLYVKMTNMRGRLAAGAATPTFSRALLGRYQGILPQTLEGPRTGESLESHFLSTFLLREQLDRKPHSRTQLIFQGVWFIVNEYF